MVTAEQIAALARPLPRVEEAWVHDSRRFRVRGLVFVSITPDEESMGFAYPKLEREALISSDPDTFFEPKQSDLRFNWVCARLDRLDERQLTELVLDAWTMVVPQKVVREYRGD